MLRRTVAILITIIGTLTLVFSGVAFARQTSLLQKNLITSSSLNAYYSFNSSSSVDYTGSHNGADTSVAYGTQYGYFGKGAFYNGAALTSLANPSSFPSGNHAYTIAVWEKTSSCSGSPVLVSLGTQTSKEAVNVTINSGTNCGNLYISWFGADKNYAGTSLSDGQWHFIATTWDGTNRTSYIDGVSIGTDQPGSANLNITYGNAYLGRATNGTEPITGNEDDVQIYNIALSASQIADLYTSRSINSGISR